MSADEIHAEALEFIRENIDRLRYKVMGILTLEEAMKAHEGLPEKKVGQGGSSISYLNGTIRSNDFIQCVPLIVRDNLSDMAYLAHVNNNEEEINNGQTAMLKWDIPKGFLNVAVIHTPYNRILANFVENHVLEIRPDIIDINRIIIPMEKYGDISVIYNQKFDVLDTIVHQKQIVYRAIGLDLKIKEKFPGLEMLRAHYPMDISKTLF